jgi:4-hydroxybenzoate polyprenyltransferase
VLNVTSSRVEQGPDIPASIVVVDLDRTLVRGDLLIEGIFGILAQRPWLLARLLWELLQGRARFKSWIAEHCLLEPTLLPYNTPVLEYVRSQRARGARIVLATAANERYAAAVADHLGLFDAVIASPADHHLAGRARLDLIEQRWPGQSFWYVGDSVGDRSICDAAARSVLVDPTRPVARRVQRAGKLERVLSSDRKIWRSLMRAMRPHQWAKNALVLLPGLTSWGFYPIERLPSLFIACGAMCLLASAVYLFNDALDLSADRAHPKKRHRPMASGELPLRLGIGATVVLFILAAACAWTLAPSAQVLLVAYAVISTAYSLGLKRVPVADLAILASLYVGRVVLGAEALEVGYSSWFLMFVTLAFLSLAAVKRYVELAAMDPATAVSNRRGYVAPDAPLIQILGVAAAFSASIVLALFTTSEAVSPRYTIPDRLLFLCPLFLLYMLRVWLSANRRSMHHDPVAYVLRDPAAYILGLAGLAVILLAR